MTEWVKRRARASDGYVEPGVLRCGCGALVTVDYDGIECHRCGQPYNLFGQRLRRDWSWSENEASDYRGEG